VASRAALDTHELPGPARHIVAVARGLFFERGYDATSVQDVVDAAGATKGAFYHYFASKDDLLRLIHEAYMDVQLRLLEAIRAEGRDPRAQLEAVIGAVVGSIPEQRESMSVFMREHRALSPASFQAIKQKRDRWEAAFRRMLEDGVAAGVFADIGDSTVLSMGLIGMCVWTAEWFDPGGPVSADELARLYSRIVLRGLESPPAPDSVARPTRSRM
jgi:AcrR family transcriptional regulator